VRPGNPIIRGQSLTTKEFPKIEEYRRYMTLCIAALCVPEKKIITVSDFLLSSEIAIESRGRKVCRIGHTRKWLTMFAGVPSYAKIILTSVNEILASKVREGSIDVINAFVASYQEMRCRHIEAAVLSSYGMNRPQFLNEGREFFGDSEFQRISQAMANVSLETSFLVAGFDASAAHICTVENPGIPTVNDQEAFAAIGCGNDVANSVLMRTFNPLLSANEIIYRLAEAKFCSEIVLGVGKRTYINILGEDGEIQRIHPDKIKPLRQLWEKTCEVPSGSNLLINELLEREV
jgi:hypothetical protein